MAKLTETDKAAFRELTKRGWEQSAEERSPRIVEPTLEARTRYVRWVLPSLEILQRHKTC